MKKVLQIFCWFIFSAAVFMTYCPFSFSLLNDRQSVQSVSASKQIEENRGVKLGLEYQFSQSIQITRRHRNQFGIDVRTKIIELSCHPYIQDKTNHDVKSGKTNRGRIAAGFKIPVIKHYQFNLSLMRDPAKGVVDNR